MIINDIPVVSNYFATAWWLKSYITITGDYSLAETCRDSQLKHCHHQSLYRNVLAFEHLDETFFLNHNGQSLGVNLVFVHPLKW